jgi:glycosyltransferase involved in cell wall biosynthesis
MIDFIVPSIGRPTIKRSLESLLLQTNPNWNCYVGFDGLEQKNVSNQLLIKDSRIQYLYLKEKLGSSSFHGNAGLVRNKIISSIEKPSTWIGFLDDDDTLSKHYIDLLTKEIEKDECDCYIFRMDLNGTIIPEMNLNTIIQNHVGISFCVKRDFIVSHNILFKNDNAEDYKFLESIGNAGGKIKILPFITYFVGR